LKDIVFHPHEERVARRRNISKDHINKTLRDSCSLVDGKFGRKIAQRKFGKYLLRVVFEEYDNHILVITKMAIKYWKDVDVLDIEIAKGEYEYSDEIAEGVILDINRKGEIISIEILDATKRLEEGLAKKLIKRYGKVEA